MMTELWKTSGILDSKEFDVIQSLVDSFVCPNDIGHIPSQIGSLLSGFTAEQWKNLTIYYFNAMFLNISFRGTNITIICSL